MPNPVRPVGFTRYDLGLLAVCLIWGANFSAIKYALAEVPPLAFSAVRFILACGLFVLVMRLLEPARQPLDRRSLRWLLGLGLIGNTVYQVAFMIGIDRTTATNSSLIMAAMPVMVAGLATVSRIERPGPRLWWGMTVAVIGVVLVVASGARFHGSSTVSGDLLILAACLCWALYTVGLRRLGREVSPLRVTAITTYAGTPGLLLLAAPELVAVPWTRLGGWTWFGLLYSGLLGIGVAYVLWSYAVQGIGGSRTAVYNSLIPIVAGIVAWAVLGERPGPLQVAGAGLVIAGLLVSQRDRPGPASPAGVRSD